MKIGIRLGSLVGVVTTVFYAALALLAIYISRYGGDPLCGVYLIALALPWSFLYAILSVVFQLLTGIEVPYYLNYIVFPLFILINTVLIYRVSTKSGAKQKNRK